MSWSGSIDAHLYANPFGSLLEGYRAGRKDVYDRAIKEVQLRDHVNKMQRAAAANGHQSAVDAQNAPLDDLRREYQSLQLKLGIKQTREDLNGQPAANQPQHQIGQPRFGAAGATSTTPINSIPGLIVAPTSSAIPHLDGTANPVGTPAAAPLKIPSLTAPKPTPLQDRELPPLTSNDAPANPFEKNDEPATKVAAAEPDDDDQDLGFGQGDDLA